MIKEHEKQIQELADLITKDTNLFWYDDGKRKYFGYASEGDFYYTEIIIEFDIKNFKLILDPDFTNFLSEYPDEIMDKLTWIHNLSYCLNTLERIKNKKVNNDLSKM